MISPNLSKWSDTEELSNLLLFAQALNELLFDHTVDSYKATALNVHSNIAELRFLATQLVEDRISSGTLIPVIEELEDKMKNDPVVSSSEGNVFEIYSERIKRARDENKPNDLLAIANALKIEMDERYWVRINERLRKAVHQPNNNREILALANIFVSEAEIQGYSRSYIYHTAQRFFFKRECEPKTINSLSQINPFLDFFNSDSPNKYRAVLRGSKSCLEMASLAERFSVQISEKPPSNIPSSFKVDSFLGESIEFPIYLIVDELEYKDPLSARDFAESYIEILSNVYCFHEHQKDPSWSKTCLILDKEENRAYVLNPAVSPMRRGTEDETSEQPDVFNTVEMLLGNHLLQRSRHIYLKALNYHRAALEAETTENQLIDLWAALEGFTPPPSKDDTRITHYVGTLLASLNLTYSEKLFRYAEKSLYRAGSEVRKVIEVVPTEGDFFTKATCLIVAEELEEERRKLYAALSNHPLLRFRCFTLHEQFSSAKHVRKSLEAHKKRVSWHIQRIYATRNQIVHSAGQVLKFL